MAKKKTTPAPTPDVARVRLDLTTEERAQLRAMAGKANLSMAAFARQAVLEAMKRRKKS